MKQESTIPSTTPKTESSKLLSQSTTPSGSRISSKTKDYPKPGNGNGIGNGNGLSSSSPFRKGTRSKPDSITNTTTTTPQKAKKSLVVNKSGVFGSSKSRELLEDVRPFKPVKNRPVAERFAKFIRPGMVDTDDLKKKVEENEAVIMSMKVEVGELKAELDKSYKLNDELQLRNNKLSQELAAAEAKIALLGDRKQEKFIAKCQVCSTKDLQKLTIELPEAKKNTISEQSPIANKADLSKMIPDSLSASPPPPPLPPRFPIRSTTARKPSVVVQLYQSLSNHDGNKLHSAVGKYNKPSVSSAHNSIVGEIQNRSAHLLAIKADIESKGELINGLIQKVLDASYSDIEDVVQFVDWVDVELSSLSDEQAVLKHFKWPEKKADAMREAAIEYRSLGNIERELSSFKVDAEIPCDIALKKMSTLLDKSEKSIQRLMKLRSSVMIAYQGFKIPTNWMHDSGIISKIKQASVKLANMYVKRITEELGSIRCSEKESTQESLLLQGVHFAYRAHKIAGSLDSETLCAFEEIRRRVPGNLRGSQELFLASQSLVSS